MSSKAILWTCLQSVTVKAHKKWAEATGGKEAEQYLGLTEENKDTAETCYSRISFCIHNSPVPPSSPKLIRSSFPSDRSHHKHPRASRWTNRNLASRGSPFLKMAVVSPVGRSGRVTQFWPVTRKKKDPRKTLFSRCPHCASVSSRSSLPGMQTSQLKIWQLFCKQEGESTTLMMKESALEKESLMMLWNHATKVGHSASGFFVKWEKKLIPLYLNHCYLVLLVPITKFGP